MSLTIFPLENTFFFNGGAQWLKNKNESRRMCNFTNQATQTGFLAPFDCNKLAFNEKPLASHSLTTHLSISFSSLSFSSLYSLCKLFIYMRILLHQIAVSVTRTLLGFSHIHNSDLTSFHSISVAQ